MSKVEIKKDSTWFSMEVLTSTQLVMSIAADDQRKSCIFERIIEYEALDADIKYLFQNIKELFDGLATLATQGAQENFCLDSDGTVHFLLEVKVLQKSIKKKVSFALQKQLKCEEEVHILRASLHSARKEIAELKEGLLRLAEDNIQLKTKFTYLEQLIMTNSSTRFEQKASEGAKSNQASKKQEPAKSDALGPTTQAHTQNEQQEISEQYFKVAPLKIAIDQNCMYYNKFAIDSNKITSQHEDYYQIYWKQPLPSKGIYSLKLKMVGQNHMSIGLLGKSALNNQYSFQNNKAVCLYSYFYGNFRGIYFRSKYQPLNWPIEKGEVIDLQIDMNEKILKLSSKGRKSIEMVNFRSLYEEQPVYFFLEMYEKDNIVEFLQ